jgi:hypothetical protein
LSTSLPDPLVQTMGRPLTKPQPQERDAPRSTNWRTASSLNYGV